MARRKAEDSFTGSTPLSPVNGDSLPSNFDSEVKKKRISIPIKEDGSLDLAAMRGPSKDRLRSALVSDPSAFREFGAESADGLAEVGPVTAEHVSMLLGGYEMLLRWAIPFYVKTHTSPPQIIPDHIIGKCIKFSPEQLAALIPPWVKFLNTSLPPWVLDWIARMGPGSEAIGMLAFMSWVMFQATIDETKQWNRAHAGQQTVEGQYATASSSAKPNGAAPHVEAMPAEEKAVV